MTTKLFTTSETSPAAAGISPGGIIRGLSRFEEVQVHGVFTGADAALDIYLQRLIRNTADGGELWADWAHYTQIGQTANEIKYSLSSKGTPTTLAMTAVAIDTTGAATPLLATGEFVGGHPGDAIRLVYDAATGTGAGAPVVIYVVGIDPHGVR